MADLEISQLEELESFLESDCLPIVDTSNASVYQTKKVSMANLFAGMPLQDVLKYTLTHTAAAWLRRPAPATPFCRMRM